MADVMDFWIKITFRVFNVIIDENIVDLFSKRISVCLHIRSKSERSQILSLRSMIGFTSHFFSLSPG